MKILLAITHKQVKKLGLCFLILLFYSCIPLRIAPKIEGDKIVQAKKFKKDLPNCYGFVFEDKKKADEFYNFINTKYNLKHSNVDSNVPIVINKKTFYMSFFERERISKTLNLLPIVVDAGLQTKGNDPIFEDNYTSRDGYWYIVISVRDAEIKDCLDPNHPEQAIVIKHLKKIKDEYFSTTNYVEAYLKMK
ncbi:hypothetical protein KBJ98_07010 [Flavobacterium sp. F-328]|uniref:Lipoprotein n=1 Tax=Flavobacterium erciyesense TaxID=2825842 RepID=A0ABS5D355_9FLAO|nr:hypothetical protein [Flavobacterium erciyesense]